MVNICQIRKFLAIVIIDLLLPVLGPYDKRLTFQLSNRTNRIKTTK